MDLNRIERKYAKVTATATDADGAPATLTGVDVALLAPHATPTATTTWTASTPVNGKWRILLAGPDASPTDALVVPSGGADLWIRVTDVPEVDAARVERITVS